MTTSNPLAHVTSRLGSPARRLAVLGLVLGGIAATVGALAQNAAAGGGFHHGSHRGAHLAAASPADMASHVEELLQHVYTQTGATPAQQAQIAPLAQAAALDLMQQHSAFQAEHGAMLALLATDPIDRVALENSRAAQLQIADQTSRTIVNLLADTHDVLTSAQRKALAEKLSMHLALHQG